MHSSCSTKLSHLPSVCRSPGPFLTFSSPFALTVNFDFLPENSFQPVRFLPLKIDFISVGRSLTLRSRNFVPPGASKRSDADPLTPSTELRSEEHTSELQSLAYLV